MVCASVRALLTPFHTTLRSKNSYWPRSKVIESIRIDYGLVSSTDDGHVGLHTSRMTTNAPASLRLVVPWPRPNYLNLLTIPTLVSILLAAVFYSHANRQLLLACYFISFTRISSHTLSLSNHRSRPHYSVYNCCGQQREYFVTER
jgi:hypothetical protein